jgi:hypothetical protein
MIRSLLLKVVRDVQIKVDSELNSIGLAILIDYNFDRKRFTILLHFIILSFDFRIFFY